MRIGFTGTRKGMTTEQATTFRDLLTDLHASALHHGACMGADEDAVKRAHHLPEIVAHPGQPADGSHNDFLSHPALNQSTSARPVRTHLSRNREIVAAADVVIGCPPTMDELPTGGTWYTLRYARDKAKKYTVCIWPDGTTTAWNQPT